MNREIKYKAWDILNNRMVTVWNISFKAWHDGEMNGITVEYNDGTYELVDGQFELLEWSGIDDLYEGDLVEWTNAFGVKFKPYIIKYEDGAFFLFTTDSNFKFNYLSTEMGRVKKIGNIYEDANLLILKVRK